MLKQLFFVWSGKKVMVFKQKKRVTIIILGYLDSKLN